MAWPWPLARALITMVTLPGLQFLQCRVLQSLLLLVFVVPPTTWLTPLPGMPPVPVPVTVLPSPEPAVGLVELFLPIVMETLWFTPAKTPVPRLLAPLPPCPTPPYPERLDTIKTFHSQNNLSMSTVHPLDPRNCPYYPGGNPPLKGGNPFSGGSYMFSHSPSGVVVMIAESSAYLSVKGG